MLNFPIGETSQKAVGPNTTPKMSVVKPQPLLLQFLIAAIRAGDGGAGPRLHRIYASRGRDYSKNAVTTAMYIHV